MARKTLDRFSDDVAEKFELFQEWLHGASKNLPSSKQIRSYLPYQKPERSIALPVALVIGGLALIGAITLLSTTNVKHSGKWRLRCGRKKNLRSRRTRRRLPRSRWPLADRLARTHIRALAVNVVLRRLPDEFLDGGKALVDRALGNA